MKSLTKLFVINAIGLVVSIILIMVLVRPTIGKVATINNDLKGKKTQLKTLETQILAFKSAQSDLSRATQRDRVTNAVLDRENLVAVVEDVEAAAANTGSEHSISITDLDPAAKAPPAIIKGVTNITEVKYTLNITNNFGGIVNFIKYMEHLPHFTEITDLRLVAETATSTSTGIQTVTRTGEVLTTINGLFFVKGAPPTGKTTTTTTPKANETKTEAE
jgi:hypothetical protein